MCTPFTMQMAVARATCAPGVSFCGAMRHTSCSKGVDHRHKLCVVRRAMLLGSDCADDAGGHQKGRLVQGCGVYHWGVGQQHLVEILRTAEVLGVSRLGGCSAGPACTLTSSSVSACAASRLQATSRRHCRARSATCSCTQVRSKTTQQQRQQSLLARNSLGERGHGRQPLSARKLAIGCRICELSASCSCARLHHHQHWRHGNETAPAGNPKSRAEHAGWLGMLACPNLASASREQWGGPLL